MLAGLELAALPVVPECTETTEDIWVVAARELKLPRDKVMLLKERVQEGFPAGRGEPNKMAITHHMAQAHQKRWWARREARRRRYTSFGAAAGIHHGSSCRQVARSVPQTLPGVARRGRGVLSGMEYP
jgi:hypothetical protein